MLFTYKFPQVTLLILFWNIFILKIAPFFLSFKIKKEVDLLHIHLIMKYKQWYQLFQLQDEMNQSSGSGSPQEWRCYTYIYIYIYRQIFHNILVLTFSLLLQIFRCNKTLYLKICNSSENVSTRMFWKICFVLFFY
jgi:hypothetical protein